MNPGIPFSSTERSATSNARKSNASSRPATSISTFEIRMNSTAKISFGDHESESHSHRGQGIDPWRYCSRCHRAHGRDPHHIQCDREEERASEDPQDLTLTTPRRKIEPINVMAKAPGRAKTRR